MALKARLSVLVLVLAWVLQSCGAQTNETDSEATAAVAIQRTVTAQSISTTATALYYSHRTPSPTVGLSLPLEIPGSGGPVTPTPLATIHVVMPTLQFVTDTPTPSTETLAQTAPAQTSPVLPPVSQTASTNTPPATVTLPGATSQSGRATLPVPPTGTPLLSVHQPTNCRAGPGSSYDLLGSLYPNTSVPVVGKDTDLNYWIVMNPDANGTCWVWGGYATVEGNTTALPAMVPSPPPAQPRISVPVDTVCRSGPGYQFTALGGLAANASANLTGRLSNSTWWLIGNPNGPGNCWLPGDLATINGNIQSLPVLDIPPGVPTPTATPTPKAAIDLSAYQCKIISRTLNDGANFQPKANFDGNWVVRNTGSAAWSPDNVEYVYVSGAEMYKYNLSYPLPKRVNPGQRVRIIVDMLAPRYPGPYDTTWGLAVDGHIFCQLPLSVHVIQP